MDISQLRQFLAVADEGHYSRAANAEHVSKATVEASVALLQEELGQTLFAVGDDGEVVLTADGIAFRPIARARVKAAPTPVAKAGGKAKASKGKGRAPVVKGEPKPFKKRQGR